MADVNFYGQIHANNDATETNFLKLSVCEPCTETASCQDFFQGAVTASATIDSVTIDTVSYDLTGARADAPETWVAEIEVILGTLGTSQEINVWVRGEHDGTNLIVKHIGRRTISALVTSAGSKTLTRNCETVTLDI